MKRFICQQSIVHFEKLLGETDDPTLRRTLDSLLATAKRELALLEADERGADAGPRRGQPADAAAIRQEFLSDFDKSPHPYMLIDPGPGLRIIDINAAYAAATFTVRDQIAGKSLFEIFPDNPDDAMADGVSNLYASLSIVARTGRPHAMAIQRYDVRDPEGIFVERHWQPVNTLTTGPGGWCFSCTTPKTLPIRRCVEDDSAADRGPFRFRRPAAFRWRCSRSAPSRKRGKRSRGARSPRQKSRTTRMESGAARSCRSGGT